MMTVMYFGWMCVGLYFLMGYSNKAFKYGGAVITSASILGFVIFYPA